MEKKKKKFIANYFEEKWEFFFFCFFYCTSIHTHHTNNDNKFLLSGNWTCWLVVFGAEVNIPVDFESRSYTTMVAEFWAHK